MLLRDLSLPITAEDARGLALVFAPALAVRLGQLHAAYGSTNCVPVPLPLIDGRLSGIALLGLYIFLSSTLVNGNGRGWTEAVRYKFFLEPVYYVFVASQFYSLIKKKHKGCE